MTDEHDDLPAEQVGTSAPPPPPPPPPPRAPRAAPRRRPSRARYRLRRVVALLTLVVILFAAWFAFELFQPFTGSGAGTVVVKIPEGSARAVGNLLERDGVVSSGFFFYVRAFLDGDRSKLRAGTFTLGQGRSYSAALSVLTAPPPPPKPTGRREIAVLIPPGFTRLQIAARAHAVG